jgi:hypothetical protein
LYKGEVLPNGFQILPKTYGFADWVKSDDVFCCSRAIRCFRKQAFYL